MDFDREKTIQYWLEGAEYDLGAADAMFETEKYPYALFMGHMTIEKLLKALVVKKTEEHAPYTHSLPMLVKKTGIGVPKNVSTKLEEFMEFFFEARYPRERKVFYDKCTMKYTKAKMNEIKEVYQWLKNQL